MDERFIDIYNLQMYDRVMNYIVSEGFNCKAMMGSLPIQHYLNVAIDDLLKGEKLLKSSTASDKPLHVNFL